MRPLSTEQVHGTPRRRRTSAWWLAACAALAGGAAAGSEMPRAAGGHRAAPDIVERGALDGAARNGAVDGAVNGAVNGEARLSSEEGLLVDALELAGAGDVDAALARVETILDRRGNFRLAQLVYADLLAVKASPLESFGGAATARDAKRRAALREEAMARLRHELARDSRQGLPASLIGVSPRYRQVVVVDVSAARLYVFENLDGELDLVADYYVSTGKNGSGKQRQNDQRTPVGVYFITGRIEAGNLPDFYGAGALPVDYPNPWDRRLGRTGYGIWIHGLPSGTYTRAPNASDGCVALANADFMALWGRLDPARTPAIMADAVSWWPRATLAARREMLAARIEQWRAARQSGDAARYAGYYANGFASDGRDRAAWLRLHRAASARQHDVEIEIADLTLLGAPGDHRVVIADFEQRYRSADRALDLGKRQYWRLEDDGEWRIVYEGVTRLREEHLKGIPVWARSQMYR